MPGYFTRKNIKGRTLVASAARVATGNSGFLDFPVEELGGKFILDVTAASGTSPTLDVSIATTSDDGTAVIVNWRFAQVTGTGTRELQTYWALAQTSDTDIYTERAALAATGGALSLPSPIADKIRVTWTIGGTNPSFTFTVRYIPFRTALTN